MIFFDIDGTLISKQEDGIPDSAVRAIRQAQKNGHVCLVNTGRSYKLVGGWLPKLLEFDGYLCGCGTHIIYRGRTLIHKTFPGELSRHMIERLERYGIDAVLEGSENNYHNRLERMHTKVFHDYMLRFAGEGYGSYEEAPGHFDKFYCYAPESGQIQGFRREYGEWLDFIDREKGFYEVVPRGFSKAGGMRRVAEHLGVSMEDTAAIGDSNNDLSMLKCAHAAIAMGNGSRAVKEIADYVTGEVEGDGIRDALDWLGVL
ncbi:MAG: HAD family hydrolase [Roseburia sp.]|nr:HAD family hydrolase [Roseburia sp.]